MFKRIAVEDLCPGDLIYITSRAGGYVYRDLSWSRERRSAVCKHFIFVSQMRYRSWNVCNPVLFLLTDVEIEQIEVLSSDMIWAQRVKL